MISFKKYKCRYSFCPNQHLKNIANKFAKEIKCAKYIYGRPNHSLYKEDIFKLNSSYSSLKGLATKYSLQIINSNLKGKMGWGVGVK